MNLSNGTGTGSAQLIAANGDIIYTTLVGQAEPTDTPGVNRIVEINTITGVQVDSRTPKGASLWNACWT